MIISMKLNSSTCLISGVAGFIGYHVAEKFIAEGYNVIGIDNINDYYDISLKEYRIGQLLKKDGFTFFKMDICEKDKIVHIFCKYQPQFVIHLAAQAGVRYSLENPYSYVSSNLVGFFNILNCSKEFHVKHLLLASSSSVYGNNSNFPFRETDSTDKPISLYAATKKSNEVVAYSYSHIYKIPITAMRFFTVYGPLGRPDMSYFKFTDCYFNGKKIFVHKRQDVQQPLYRDFTYIDDVVESIYRLLKKAPTDKVPFRIVNIGNNHPVSLDEFIRTLEACLSKSYGYSIEFDKEFIKLSSADVVNTYASTDALKSIINFVPNTPIEIGLKKFTEWYHNYYQS